jgi:4-amino-4-deoxy-L-arabinose transferase-like glycosyltransferase
MDGRGLTRGAVAAQALPAARTAVPAPAVEVVVPVRDEEVDLEPSIRRLVRHLRDGFPHSWRVTIADNGSTDATWSLARRLAQEDVDVRAIRLEAMGRGGALQETWGCSDAEVVVYMDVDLSTDLAALLPLVDPLLADEADVAIGSRLHPGAVVERGFRRQVLSRAYNRLVRTVLGARFTDAQCGFKALRADRARILVPRIRSRGWFFDTELLVLAERAGLRIREVPVRWIDDPDSRVDVLDTASELARGVARLAAGLATGSAPVAELQAELGTGPAAPDRPRWARPALLALLVGTALLYLWGLGAAGWANSYYTAAAQAGAARWSAFFFGSLDAGNAITVDKPPAALWVMALSVRAFGLSSWSVLAPQALLGVTSVALLHATVRRVWTPGAGLLAGAALALTPVATLMFRYTNPDALLVTLLVGAAYATTRAVEAASRRWITLAGVLIGLGFLTKMLQALVVLPVLAGVYLLAAPARTRRRLGDLAVGGAAVVLSAGWWVAVVERIPVASRPHVGGSSRSSVIELALGYNGLGRLTGDQPGVAGLVAAQGEAGPLRLLNPEFGGQAAWLLPAALLLLVAMLRATQGTPRTDPQRASLLLWGGWLLLTAGILSSMRGVVHPYATVALAPAIAALVGVGATQLWARRAALPARLVLAAALLVTTATAVLLLGRAPAWNPWLGPLVTAAGAAGAVLVVLDRTRSGARRAGLAGLALAAALGAPAAASLATVANPQQGSVPSASPVVGGPTQLGGPGAAIALPPGAVVPWGTGPGSGAGPGEPLVDALLAARAAGPGATWVAAVVGAPPAADLQLATAAPVLAIGGFLGLDPAPTLDDFTELVDRGEVERFVDVTAVGGGRDRLPGGTAAAEITAWVRGRFAAVRVDGVPVYDLTTPRLPGRPAEGA